MSRDPQETPGGVMTPQTVGLFKRLRVVSLGI